MARSIEAPFRREFMITSKGVLGGGDIYVGDIKTLYIGMYPTASAAGVIEGKIGRDGKYTIIPFSLTEGRSGPIDVSGIEFIKFTASIVSEPTDINMFGYYDAVNNEETIIRYNEDEEDRSIITVSLLEDIKEELQKLNLHMSVITGEEIE